jgi:hypothetical protein
MNPFLLPPKPRLSEWKKLRDSLKDLVEIDQLNAVAKYWAQAPLLNIAYDPERLDLYPSPWEMMNANKWCRNSIAVGMDFTLRLSGWETARLIVKMMRDYDISDQKLILEIDGDKLLNYDYGIVSNIPKTKFVILNSWNFSNKNYSQKT